MGVPQDTHDGEYHKILIEVKHLKMLVETGHLE